VKDIQISSLYIVYSLLDSLIRLRELKVLILYLYAMSSKMSVFHMQCYVRWVCFTSYIFMEKLPFINVLNRIVKACLMYLFKICFTFKMTPFVIALKELCRENSFSLFFSQHHFEHTNSNDWCVMLESSLGCVLSQLFFFILDVLSSYYVSSSGQYI